MPISKRPSAKSPQAAKKPTQPRRAAPRKPASPPQAPAPAKAATEHPPATSKVEAASAQPAPTAAGPATTELPARLTELFRLNADEQRLLGSLWHSPAVRTVADLSAERGLSLSLLLSLLSPEGTLRGRALVELPESAALGWALPSDGVTLGRGLAVALQAPRRTSSSDERALFVQTLPGLSYLPAPASDTAWAQDLIAPAAGERPSDKLPPAIVELVREHLTAPQPVLLSVGGVQGDQLAALAQIARQRQQRPLVMLDGSALAGWPLPAVAQALRRLRRDTDLRGAVLLLHDVRGLGAAWRSILLPRPAGQTAPLIIASDGPALPMGTLPASPRDEAPWTLVSVTLRPQPLPSQAATAAGPVPTVSADASDEGEDPAVAASRQEARRQAAIDAARAMGRPVPKELLTPTPAAKPAAPATATTPSTHAAVSAPAANRSTPAPAAAPPAAPAAAAPPAASPPASKAAAPASPTADAAQRRAMNPRLAAALAAAGLPPPGSDEYANSEYAKQRAAARAAAAAERGVAPTAASPTPVPAATQTPEPAAPPAPEPTPAVSASSAPPPAASPPASAAEASTDEEGAALPLDAEAPLEELLRVARTTPNSLQRAEILRKLTGARHSAVIALFRTFVSSQHPAVREAAEGGMSSLFGPHWNRTRSIAPPAQPPRSDDNGRGPGGAF